MANISEIWIINETGKPLFNKSIDSQVDPALFSGFLSAIQSFVQSSFEGSKIDRLFLGESKISFLYMSEFHIYVVIRTPKKIKDKEIAKYLEKISYLFISNFKEKLREESSEVSEFREFNKILEENFEETKVVKRMTNWFDEL